MFFSNDLLLHKSGPFSRIWYLGSLEKEKLKKPDYKYKVTKLLKMLREWIQRQDAHRLSLYLSSSLTFGVVRILHGQVAHLKQEVSRTKTNLAKSLRLAQSLNEPIEMPPHEEDLIPEPEPLDFEPVKLFNDTDTGIDNNLMREHPPIRESEHFGQDFGFGDFDDGTFGAVDPNQKNDLFGDIFGEEEQLNPEMLQQEQMEVVEENLQEDVEAPQLEKLDKLDGIDPMAMENTDMTAADINENQANAPERVHGPPNGCREKSPPVYKEIIASPREVPPLEVLSTPPREQEPHFVDPEVEAPLGDALELNTLDSTTKKPGVKRKPKGQRGKRAKCLIIDIDPQIPMETLRQNRQAYERNFGQDTEIYPIMLPRSSVDDLFEHFGRPGMPKSLTNLLHDAAFEEKFDNVEEEPMEQENFDVMIENELTSDLRQNQDTMATRTQASIGNRKSSICPNPEEKIVEEPVIDVIAEERSSQIEPEDVPIEPMMPPPSPEHLQTTIQQDETMPPSLTPPAATIPDQSETIPIPSIGSPPAFNSNHIFGNINGKAIEFKELMRKMGLERRRDVAFAFFNVLELIRDGNITSEQDEFLGPLMVKKEN